MTDVFGLNLDFYKINSSTFNPTQTRSISIGRGLVSDSSQSQIYAVEFSPDLTYMLISGDGVA